MLLSGFEFNQIAVSRDRNKFVPFLIPSPLPSPFSCLVYAVFQMSGCLRCSSVPWGSTMYPTKRYILQTCIEDLFILQRPLDEGQRNSLSIINIRAEQDLWFFCRRKCFVEIQLQHMEYFSPPTTHVHRCTWDLMDLLCNYKNIFIRAYYQFNSSKCRVWIFCIHIEFGSFIFRI